jgi:RNA polymerase sigma factor (sigma-70 family)
MDDALLARARSGSDDAFSRLVTEHQQAVRGFLRRLCMRPDDADDLAQESFVAAWANLHRLKAGTAFRSFVCGIAYRKALNDRRRIRRTLRRDSDWLETRPQQAEPTVEARLTVHDLPLDQRAAISLCVAADYSHAEAAAILGLPLGTIKSHIQKGRARLSALLGVAHDA